MRPNILVLTSILLALIAKNSFSADRLECANRVVMHRAPDDTTFDSATGKDPRRYPPDPQVDFQHIKLDLRMPEPMSKRFDCTETITFRTLGRPIARVKLNAVELDIKKVTDLAGNALEFSADDKTVSIRLAKELPPATEGGVVIEYSCHDPKSGMIFALPVDGYKDRPLMIHTQGEAEQNRYWFVCHDSPNERQTTEIIATVPSNLSVLSNGGLVSKEDAGNGQTRWHYKLGHPHVSYLVSLAIGQFEVVKDKWRDVPVEYWVPPEKKNDAMRTFGKTPKMMELFSKLTGADYPYEKYAQSVIYEFAWGGMENTSCTTLTEGASLDERAAIDRDEEGLISHELAHQWFGDMLTCKSWPHLWLNEGFATFMEQCWQEAERGREEYDYELWNTMREVADTDKPDAHGGLVYPEHEDDGDFDFSRGSDPYGKGASVLHMLRRSLGDDLFWRCIQEYVKRNAWKQVESDDLRKVIEELSGRSYERFFQQYVYRGGVPSIDVSYEWDDDAKAAKIQLAQTQNITSDLPAFDVEIPVWVVSTDGQITKSLAHVNERSGSLSLKSDKEPAQVVIDPEGAVLMKLGLDELPAKLLVAQALSGPTPRARLDAIASLSEKDRDAARDALKTILLDEKQHHSVREQAALSLGRMQQPAAREILIASLAEDHSIQNPKVRRAAVEALGKYRHPDSAATLMRYAKSDPTYTVEAEATLALGSQDSSDALVAVLLENYKKPSYRDQIRVNAVDALAALNDPRGIEPAKTLAAYGEPFRSRPRALEALAKLARSQDEKTRRETAKFLATLLNDPQDRTASAAINGLATLGGEQSIDPLRKFADSSAKPDLRRSARDAIDKIEKHSGESESVKDLRERIEILEKARRATTKPSEGK